MDEPPAIGCRGQMQIILVIRHARAEERESWAKADELRPLTRAGQAQALAIAKKWGGEGAKSIRSSPAVRCVQTVQPLADRVGVDVAIDPVLREGSKLTLPEPKQTGLHALCAHGDNIPWLLDDLGIDWKECKKGSIWMLKRDGKGRVVESSYLPPP